MLYRELVGCTDEVLHFSKKCLGGAVPERVRHQFIVGAQPLDCFMNVQKMIAKLGGEMVCGWHVYQFSELFLEAEAHAVWREPKEHRLIDVTPGNVEDGEKILFIPDTTWTWKEGVSRPKVNRFYPLSTDSRVLKFVELQKKRVQIIAEANRTTPYGMPMCIPDKARSIESELENLLLDLAPMLR